MMMGRQAHVEGGIQSWAYTPHVGCAIGPCSTQNSTTHGPLRALAFKESRTHLAQAGVERLHLCISFAQRALQLRHLKRTCKTEQLRCQAAWNALRWPREQQLSQPCCRDDGGNQQRPLPNCQAHACLSPTSCRQVHPNTTPAPTWAASKCSLAEAASCRCSLAALSWLLSAEQVPCSAPSCCCTRPSSSRSLAASASAASCSALLACSCLALSTAAMYLEEETLRQGDVVWRRDADQQYLHGEWQRRGCSIWPRSVALGCSACCGPSTNPTPAPPASSPTLQALFRSLQCILQQQNSVQ